MTTRDDTQATLGRQHSAWLAGWRERPPTTTVGKHDSFTRPFMLLGTWANVPEHAADPHDSPLGGQGVVGSNPAVPTQVSGRRRSLEMAFSISYSRKVQQRGISPDSPRVA
jgi:hypothetical protein